MLMRRFLTLLLPLVSTAFWSYLFLQYSSEAWLAITVHRLEKAQCHQNTGLILLASWILADWAVTGLEVVVLLQWTIKGLIHLTKETLTDTICISLLIFAVRMKKGYFQPEYAVGVYWMRAYCGSKKIIPVCERF